MARQRAMESAGPAMSNSNCTFTSSTKGPVLSFGTILLAVMILCLCGMILSRDTVTDISMENTRGEVKKQRDSSTDSAMPFIDLNSIGPLPAVPNLPNYVTERSWDDKCADTDAIWRHHPATALDMNPATTPKPFWIPAMPDAGHELVRTLIRGLTGKNAAHKNYYLKRCAWRDVTVTCSSYHPQLGTKPAPETLAGTKFNSRILLLLRNPATNIPAHVNSKYIKYHANTQNIDEEQKLKLQMPLNYWRKLRDNFLNETVQTWKSFVTEWRQRLQHHYTVGMYLTFENLTNSPGQFHALAEFFRRSNFSVAPVEDLDCIWYHNLLRQTGDDYEVHRVLEYPYGYTLEQKDFLLTTLRDLQVQFARDVALVEILQDYITDIENNLWIDQPYTDNNNVTNTNPKQQLP